MGGQTEFKQSNHILFYQCTKSKSVVFRLPVPHFKLWLRIIGLSLGGPQMCTLLHGLTII